MVEVNQVLTRLPQLSNGSIRYPKGVNYSSYKVVSVLERIGRELIRQLYADHFKEEVSICRLNLSASLTKPGNVPARETAVRKWRFSIGVTLDNLPLPRDTAPECLSLDAIKQLLQGSEARAALEMNNASVFNVRAAGPYKFEMTVELRGNQARIDSFDDLVCADRERLLDNLDAAAGFHVIK